MPLSTHDVAGIADYARIALNEDELAEMTTYLNEAVELLQPIREYDLADVPPTFHPIGELSNVMSDDVEDVERALERDRALAGAGASREGCFRVPSILGDQGGDR